MMRKRKNKKTRKKAEDNQIQMIMRIEPATRARTRCIQISGNNTASAQRHVLVWSSLKLTRKSSTNYFYRHVVWWLTMG